MGGDKSGGPYRLVRVSLEENVELFILIDLLMCYVYMGKVWDKKH